MPDPVFLDSEDAYAWLDQHQPEQHDPDPWRHPVSIAPTPIPPGAAQAAAERRAIIRDETGRVAVALIGRGIDLVPECVGDCKGRPRVCRALGECERLPVAQEAMARDIAQALGLIPTVPGRPNRGTSAERAMSRKAKR